MYYDPHTAPAPLRDAEQPEGDTCPFFVDSFGGVDVVVDASGRDLEFRIAGKPVTPWQATLLRDYLDAALVTFDA